MNKYFCEYKILPDNLTRDDCMTLFGGMTQKDDLKELGKVNLLGRWSTVGEARGFCLAEAPSSEDMQKWLLNWVPMADISVTPCLDDNEQRELILKTKADYSVEYDNISGNPKENESLYFIKYKFKCGKKEEGFKQFASMTQEMDTVDSGNCTSYGRWHVPSEGWGCAVASSPTVLDVYKWAYNWDSLCNCEIIPVTTDEVIRKIIKSKPGFKKKHEELMEELHIEETCFISAKFPFKDEESKNKFIDILNGPKGLEVTRNSQGCLWINCFESTDNPCEFIIQQKWEKEADHTEYLEMRKRTGLFDTISEMLETPLEIVHMKENTM